MKPIPHNREIASARTLRRGALWMFASTLLFGTIPAYGATIPASSCSTAAVQSAINAAAPGDTVTVPAGACTWSTAVTVPDSKSLQLMGAGAGTTIITIGAISPALSLGSSDSSLAGFTFQSASSSNSFVEARGDGAVGRIHHNSFINTTGSNRRCIYLSGGTGVPHPVYLIDHNTFSNCRISLAGDVGPGFGSREWQAATPWGTFRACVYVEDNSFVYTHGGNSIETDYGACAVVRFNSFTGSGEIHQHGTSAGNSAEHPPGRVIEMYHNVCNQDGDNNSCTWFRSGTGLIFGNSIGPSYGTPIVFDIQGRSPSGGVCATAPCCDGSVSTDGNQASGSTYPAAGWPCFSQPGFGGYQSTWSRGANPGLISMPIPIFLNRQNGVKPGLAFMNNSSRHINNCHEFQDEVTATAFNGSCGTGVGTAAQFATKASCTPGVYFWVTDQGEWNSQNAGPDGRLYKCTATNTWSAYYTPYTYPHPLAGSSTPPPPSAPSAPQDIRIIR